MKIISSFLLFLLTLLVISTDSLSQLNTSSLNKDDLNGLEYRSVGPTRGGRSTAITGVPGKPFLFYMGATGGGVWKTDDAGTTWHNISDQQIKAGSIGAITVAPSDENVIYVGTGSAAPRGNISPGIGIYRSTDAGDNWTFLGLPNSGQIGKIEVHPTNPDIAYVAALGNIFKPNNERGVYRTSDGGKTWQKVLYINDKTGAVDLSLNPDNPRIIYAAMWRAERKPWTMIDGGEEGGIWKSIDGGDTWNKLTNGLPGGTIGRIGISVSPANPARVFAIIQTQVETDGGVYRSDDHGKSWEKVNRDHKLRQRGWYYSHITAHPTNENTVFVSNTGFYKSIDGGKSFDIRIGTPHGDNHGVWVNPNHPEIMINCNDGGANVTLNGGKSWSTQLNQPTSEFYRVTIDNQFPYRLYAGQQDNTTISVPSQTSRSLTPYQNWFSAGGGESADVVVDPSNADIIYAGTYSGEITFMDRSADYVRQVTAYPHYTEGTEMRDLKYRWQWNFPVTIHPDEPNTVFQTSNYVMKSSNMGQTWEVISPDLTQDLDKYHDIPGGPVQHDATGVEVYSTIFAFEIDPSDKNVMWAGSDDGLIHITKDGGANWTNITPRNMPAEGTVNKIALSNHGEGRALVAVYKYRRGDFKPYIYLTNDYGSSWELLTEKPVGIPESHFVRAIAEDPDRKGLFYAGTEFGVYFSIDNGKSWQPFQMNLPHTPVTDMEVYNKDLILSTQGRAFWILDDLSPLHQINNETLAKEFYLYNPEDGYRSNLSQENNINIYYHLKAKPDSTDNISIVIKDSDGKVVREYKSSEGDFISDKGLNKFQWNIRHEGPELVSNLVTMVVRNPAPGPKVVPGTYTAEMTHNSETQSGSFEIKIDPRWKDYVTVQDLQAQNALAVEVTEVFNQSQKMIKNLRAIKEQSTDLSKRLNDNEEIQSVSKKLNSKADDIESMIIQNKAEASQDNINYPRVFSNHIGRLYSVMAYSEGRPTGGVLERWEDIKKEFSEIETSYNAFMNTEFKEYSELLKSEEVDLIIVGEE